MQFQVRGNIIRVLAYRGYDAVKKRAKVEMIGSLTLADLAPNDKLLENLTDKEKLELAQYIEKEQQDRQKQLIQETIKLLPENMNLAAKAIHDGRYQLKDEEAQDLILAIKNLTKHLTKLSKSD